MAETEAMRLDKWLWFVRLAHSRGRAREICESRHLRLDGRVIERGGALLRIGSVISFPRGAHLIAVRVEGLPERRGPAPEARGFYTPLLPAPDARLAGHPGFAAAPAAMPVARNAIDDSRSEAVAQSPEKPKLLG